MNITSKFENELNRYHKLKTDLINISNSLISSIDNIDEASIQLDNYYLLDDNSVDNKIFKDSIKEISSALNILNDTILPAIDAKIEQLNVDIKQKQETVVM